MKPGDFPLQKDCNPKKPSEFIAWALVALPHMKGAALPMSSEYIQLVCEHLWMCGVRLPVKKDGTPRFQQRKWLPPSAGDAHWLTNPGRWVKMDHPDPPHPEVNMVTVLKAMKESDENSFFSALDDLMKEK